MYSFKTTLALSILLFLNCLSASDICPFLYCFVTLALKPPNCFLLNFAFLYNLIKIGLSCFGCHFLLI